MNDTKHSEIIRMGARVKVFEGGHVVARGEVQSYNEQIGWYCVRIDGVPQSFLANYPALRVERE